MNIWSVYLYILNVYNIIWQFVGASFLPNFLKHQTLHGLSKFRIPVSKEPNILFLCKLLPSQERKQKRGKATPLWSPCHMPAILLDPFFVHVCARMCVTDPSQTLEREECTLCLEINKSCLKDISLSIVAGPKMATHVLVCLNKCLSSLPG